MHSTHNQIKSDQRHNSFIIARPTITKTPPDGGTVEVYQR